MDRSLEALPLFRLSDSSDSQELVFSPAAGTRWRVIAYPGDRLPGTFDQDVYVELLRRFHDAGSPGDGAVTFTLHSFLRSIGRRADGRTYEQLRASLTRLERTVLESDLAYHDAAAGASLDGRFTLLSSVAVQRRRAMDQHQLALFPLISSGEPGEARVVLSSPIRKNLRAGHTTTLENAVYTSLRSAVARRLYRLIQVIRKSETGRTWRVSVPHLAGMLPLAQRYPSHLQRVLHPAHEMLTAAGLMSGASLTETGEGWAIEYRFDP
jgi:plasmid replication initiation protein